MSCDEDSLDSRAARTGQLFLQACKDAGFWVSSDLRISIEAAAELVGLTVRGLRKRIGEGATLRVYRLGCRGSKQTVRLYELAAWVEEQSEN